jgi:hypothetical protein
MWPFNKKKVVKHAPPHRGRYISDSNSDASAMIAADTLLDTVMLASVMSDPAPVYHNHAEAYSSGSSYDSGSSDCGGGCDCGGGGD